MRACRGLIGDPCLRRGGRRGWDVYHYNLSPVGFILKHHAGIGGSGCHNTALCEKYHLENNALPTGARYNARLIYAFDTVSDEGWCIPELARMPIYEYQCEACGHELEAIQKFSDAALKDCPVCGESTLKKLVSAAGFQLKGTGWYATDFKDSGKSKVKKESEPESKPKKEEKTKAGTKASGSSSSDQ